MAWPLLGNSGTLKRSPMNGSDEQTEILRGMSQQMGDMSRRLEGRIEQTNAHLERLNARIEQTNARLDDFAVRTNENFARVQRNLEAMHDTLVLLVRRDARVEELDARLTRVEQHVGLADRETP
jgi:septal ring factor EnvC (AmiA/AmiB activator)